jgi:threonyl-tRNA synthetase
MSYDHRDLVQAMDLAHFEAHSPGVVFWHANGVRVLRRLEAFCRHLHAAEGYDEVRSPQLLSRSLWEQSGHWAKYQDLMYVVRDEDLALKPMSCPGHMAIYADARRSYRDLPFRLFEFGAVHRQEPSGALSGLLRLRGFVQDDAHVILAQHQLQAGVAAFVRLVEQAYPAMGFDSWSYRIALRPEQRAGDNALWDEAENALRQAVAALGLQADEEPGGGAFYGPKLEVVLRDRLGRAWQCGVVQVDFVLPQQFGLQFQNSEGKAEQPVMLHHAVFGSLERFLAILLEHHGGLPDGLAPRPVAVCPISEAQEDAADALVQQLRAAGVPAQRVSEGPLNGRLRHLAQAHVPVWAILGAREVAQDQVMVRCRGEGKGRVWARQEWVAHLAQAWHQVAPVARLSPA